MFVQVLYVHLLVGNDPYGEAADAGIATENSLSVLRLVLIPAAAIDDAANDFFHVIGASGIGIDDAEQLFLRQQRSFRFDVAEGRGWSSSHLLDERAYPRNTAFVVGLAIVDRA